MRWYLVHTKSRQEISSEKPLAARLSMLPPDSAFGKTSSWCLNYLRRTTLPTLFIHSVGAKQFGEKLGPIRSQLWDRTRKNR